MQLQGKRTLVTGGARGIGLAIAQKFIDRGARVAIADIDGPGAERAAESLGAGSIGLHLDVTDPAQVQQAIGKTVAAFGGLDVMVNNAGIEVTKPLVETTDEELARVLDVNVKGVFYGIKYAVPALVDAGGGNIVNLSSLAGLAGVPLLSAYCASKAAVLRLTQTAAIELRPMGIRVNAICPGLIQTAMLDRLGAAFESASGIAFGDLTTQVQGRTATPEEVAEVAAYLASDDASFVTGSSYNIDNGAAASTL